MKDGPAKAKINSFMAFTSIIQASDHAIKSVAVFRSQRAEVVRTFTLDLQKGQNKIEIIGLSSSIDTDSVRVSGLGDARLLDIVCTLGNSKAAHISLESPSEVIRGLLIKKAGLENEKSIREQQSQLLLKYAQTVNGKHSTPIQMGAFLESYAEHGRIALQAVAQLDKQIMQVEHEIEVVQEKAASKRGTTLGQVDIDIFADTERSIELKLTYMVSNVQWKPTYKLHATTENEQHSPFVSLHYQAMVTQATGEDWNNISLTLSTMASDKVLERIPQLRPVKLVQASTSNSTSTSAPVQLATFAHSFVDTQNVAITPPSHSSEPGIGVTPFAQRWAELDAGEAVLFPEEVDRLTAISESTIVVSETPITVSFLVHGESTIPSDGIDHQVSVAILPLEAKISYICAPRIDPRVFLQCEVKNSSEYLLLSGPVTVNLDDSYVSETSINDINSGDNFGCTLGHEASTKVTYSRSGKTVKLPDEGAFSEVTNTTSSTVKISIHNKHRFDINNLIVREVVPTSDDKRAKILVCKPVGLSDAKDGVAMDLKNDRLKVGWEPGKRGEKEGRFEWKCKVGKGEKVDLEAEWEITVPGDAPWVELEQVSVCLPEDDWRFARTNLLNLKTGPLQYVKFNKEVKAKWRRMRRQFVLKIGQLTNDPVAISGISIQLIEMIKPSIAPPHNPHLYIALCYSLAKAIVLQAETEVEAAKHSAGPLAQLAFNLLEALDDFPSIFFAKLVQRCGGWAIPIVVPDHDVDDIPWSSQERATKVAGWRRSKIGEGLETTEEYSNRVSAIMRLYFTILKTRPNEKALDPMFQLPRYWTWFARMVGDTKLLQEAAAPQLIYTALDVLGLDAKDIWGQQWIKMLSLIHEGVTTGYENGKLIGRKPSEGARTRVLVALENIADGLQS